MSTENRQLRILELSQTGIGNLWRAKVRVSIPQEFGSNGEFIERLDITVTLPCNDDQTVEALKHLAIQSASDIADNAAQFLASGSAGNLLTNT